VTGEQPPKKWALFRKRQCTLPTWRGCLLLVIIFAVLCLAAGRHLHGFLAVTQPVHNGVLVVEGWAPDYALEQAKVEFEQHHYSKLLVVGGPLEWGAPLSEYKTYAERGTAVLVKLGLTTNEVQAVPAPLVRADRTYTAALSLRRWAADHNLVLNSLHLMSEGPHTRRSRLVFEKALGPKTCVGVTAISVRDYDAEHWWRSSAGVRGVVGEFLAYLYARFLFYPAKQ